MESYATKDWRLAERLRDLLGRNHVRGVVREQEWGLIVAVRRPWHVWKTTCRVEVGEFNCRVIGTFGVLPFCRGVQLAVTADTVVRHVAKVLRLTA